MRGGGGGGIFTPSQTPRISLHLSAPLASKSHVKVPSHIPIPTLSPVKSPSQVALIAGNAPSLSSINLARLPSSYHIFRCNQFYLEESYYTGRRVDYACFTEGTLLENYYTLLELMRRGEYEAGAIITNSQKNPCYVEYFPSMLVGTALLQRLPAFSNFLDASFFFDVKMPTTGVLMVAYAVALGYKQLYIGGIDFYEAGGVSYGLNTKGSNITTLLPELYTKQASPFIFHTKDLDLQALMFLQQEYDITIYALTSPLDTYFPLAPIISPHAPLESKPKDALQDMLFPPVMLYRKAGLFPPQWGGGGVILRWTKQHLRENIYFRIVLDAFRLVRILVNILRDVFTHLQRKCRDKRSKHA